MLKTLVWRASPPAQDGAASDGAAQDGAGANGSAGVTDAGVLCQELEDPQQISDVLASPGRYLWLDLTAPSAAELRLIKEEFSLHPLAIEDASKHSQRPKIEQYDGFYLMVVFAITQAEGPASADSPATAGQLAGASVTLHEIDLFIGERFLISVHEAGLPFFEQMADRWQHNQRVLNEGIGVLVYTMLDGIVDAYFPILDEIVDRIEDLEEALFTTDARPSTSGPSTGARSDDVRNLFQLKKDLIQMRRVIAPERDSLLVLTRQEAHLFDRRVTLYFQDVYDHVVRLTDTIDVYQDLLTNALDSYLAIVSNNLNQVMKTLTALTVILMVPTLIAGVYGMNFEHMPELQWVYGYPLTLGIMALAATSLYLIFRRRGWI
ncbi:MAG: magnesium/cobalt transporter CorA [Chloroflexota bacterium]|nr:magnesium/cobalt transporter CorA [Chloroflexota bacterium]